MPGGNHVVNRGIILLLGLLVTAFFLCTSRSYFAGGAGSFLQYAAAITGGEKTVDIFQRDIGYPLLLVLTGFTVTGSLIGVIAAQAAMAVAAPLLVYQAVGMSRPRAALAAALMAIVSLVPYQFIKMIYPDQLYTFLSLACASAYLWFIRCGQPVALYVMTVLIIGVSFTRPAGTAIFPFLLLCAWLFRRGPIKHYLIAGVLFVASSYGYYEHRRFIMGLQPHEAMPSYTGHQIFQNAYLFSRDMNVPLTADIGRAVRRVMEEIRKEFPDPANHPRLAEYRTASPEFFKAALDIHDGAEFVKRVFERPSMEYWIIYHQMPAVVLDTRLFFRAFWEVAAKDPLYPVRYTLRNVAHFIFLPGYYFPGHEDVSYQIRSGPQYLPQFDGNALLETGLTQRAIREVSYVPLETDFAYLKGASGFLQRQIEKKYNELNRIVVGLSLIAIGYAMFVGAQRLWTRRWRGDVELVAGVVGGVGIVLYNALITSAFVDPIHRYHYMTMLVEIICAGFGLRVLTDFICKLRRRSALGNAMQS